MPRRERPGETRRSEHWLRVAVNDCAEAFNKQIKLEFGWNSSELIEWCSPTRADDRHALMTAPNTTTRNFWTVLV
jgi:hypothetical protein